MTIEEYKKELKTKQSKNVSKFEEILKRLELKYETEYKFSKQRRFKFDIALVTQKIAIEYEGVNAKKSRHTSITGYTNDCTKYNLAQIEGWKILRYTTLNFNDFEKDISRISNKVLINDYFDDLN